MNRIAYLLCELKARDFAARLMIAEEILNRGCPVVVGQRWSIVFNAPYAPRGAYLFPTSNAIQAASMEGVKSAGHVIAAADEEALALSGDAVLLNVAPATLDRAVFFTHSTAQHEVLQKRYPKADFRLTGSARVDLLLREAAEPVRETGYILFNTNFPMTNGLWGDRAASAEPLRQAGLTDIEERFAFEEARKAGLIPVIENALKSLSVPIVIRPHPAESPAMWHELAKDYPQARVIVGEQPGPWIAGASIVVHADCTTGLEAALMGRPVLNISTHGWGHKFLMRTVNPTVTSAAAGWDALRAFLAGAPLPAPIQATVTTLPPGGARQTAVTMLALLDAAGAKPLGGQFRWEKVTRPDVLKHKFSASRSEVEQQMKGLCAAIHEIDDSTFLLLPKT